MEFKDMIITYLDLSNYKPKLTLYEDYDKLINMKLKNYKKKNNLPPFTEDIIDAYGDIILSKKMQELNRDAEIKDFLRKETKIEITTDNLSIYFEEKPKSEVDILKEQIAQLMALLQAKQ